MFKFFKKKKTLDSETQMLYNSLVNWIEWLGSTELPSKPYAQFGLGKRDILKILQLMEERGYE